MAQLSYEDQTNNPFYHLFLPAFIDQEPIPQPNSPQTAPYPAASPPTSGVYSSPDLVGYTYRFNDSLPNGLDFDEFMMDQEDYKLYDRPVSSPLQPSNGYVGPMQPASGLPKPFNSPRSTGLPASTDHVLAVSTSNDAAVSAANVQPSTSALSPAATLGNGAAAVSLPMWKPGMTITIPEKQAAAAVKAAMAGGGDPSKAYGGDLMEAVSSMVQIPAGVPLTLLEAAIWVPKHLLRPGFAVRALLAGLRRKQLAKIILAARDGLTNAKRLRSMENRIQNQYKIGYNTFYNVCDFTTDKADARAETLRKTNDKGLPIDMTADGWFLREEYGSPAKAQEARNKLHDCYLVDMASGVPAEQFPTVEHAGYLTWCIRYALESEKNHHLKLSDVPQLIEKHELQFHLQDGKVNPDISALAFSNRIADPEEADEHVAAPAPEHPGNWVHGGYARRPR